MLVLSSLRMTESHGCQWLKRHYLERYRGRGAPLALLLPIRRGHANVLPADLQDMVG